MIPKWFSNYWKKNSASSPTASFKKIRLGICAMDKKAKSKPMNEILNRLPPELFEIEIFGDEMILRQPIENWPIVEVLISFYSSKFPTEKALEYVQLRKPYLINDLNEESTLKDRRKVYKLLVSIGIDVPNHVFVNRVEGTEDTNVIEEYDEYIVVNGTQINKPLVEKPVDAENHNIHIYYPSSAGGGCKHLFRKVNDRSSEFFPEEHDIRRDGSYIYEEFVVTQGTDVKVYTVGPDYAHAEARKSPVVDGKVQRNEDKKEIRYPVILTPNEKDMARRIVTAFKQTVCGFDILRVHGKSYCCDVNGFSFVKNSRKYYEDAAKILTEIMISAVRADFPLYSTRVPLIRRVPSANSPSVHNGAKKTVVTQLPVLDENAPSTLADLKPVDLSTSNDDRAGSPAASMVSDAEFSTSSITSRRYDLEELRCVIAVIRHGDRTPKQKIKLVLDEPTYLSYYHKYSKGPKKDLKLKSKSGLIEFLKVTNEVLQENKSNLTFDVKRRLTQIRDVLERWEISGINRKLQMKPQKWDEKEDGSGTGLATEVLIILKWGGDLTPLGRAQAEELGTMFRTQNYPNDNDNDNRGVIRLHATYRHDLKIKASDEGRVMKTAAAFAKGLLELEGQLTPILASLVTIEEKNRLMLDRGGNFEVKEETDRCKAHLNLLQVDAEITDELIQQVAPDCPPTLKQAFYRLGNPLKTLQRIHYLIGRLTSQLELLIKEYSSDQEESVFLEEGDVVRDLSLGDGISLKSELINEATNTPHLPHSPPRKYSAASVPPMIDASAVANIPVQNSPANLSKFTNTPTYTPAGGNSVLTSHDGNEECDSPPRLYNSETYELMLERWEKLHKDFYSNKTNQFDLTKVPDVYDMIRYDILHNSHLQLSGMEELYRLAADFETCVVPQEYGIDREDKRYIGSKMCGALIEKIKSDLLISASNYQGGRGSINANINDTLGSGATSPIGDGRATASSTVPTSDSTLAVTESSSSNTQAPGPESGSSKEDNSTLYKLDYSHAEDLRINSLERFVRTRLYFTSESHLHTILNVFRYPKIQSMFSLSKEAVDALNSITNVSYLSQFVIRLFEDRRESNKYHCELLFSTGVTMDPINDKLNSITPYVCVTKSMDLSQLLGCLSDIVELYHSDTRLDLVKELSQAKLPPENDASLEKKAETNENGEIESAGIADEGNRQHYGSEEWHIGSGVSMKGEEALIQENILSPPRLTVENITLAQKQLRKSDPISLKKSNSFTVQMDALNSASDSWERGDGALRHIEHHHHHHHHGVAAKSRSSLSLLPPKPASISSKSGKKESTEPIRRVMSTEE
eukprot:gene2256-2398_t